MKGEWYKICSAKLMDQWAKDPVENKKILKENKFLPTD
jgi:hypothetical protein